jgi:hypothetical protein
MDKSLVLSEFPIKSQTSLQDKIVILKVISLFEFYTYCEIGSFLGGSLTPHIKNEKCLNILSIDDRERAQPDERGVLYDYEGITSSSMIDNLKSVNLSIDKIETFDGSIQDLKNYNKQFDLIFIDGEHTDIACFRDFVYSLKLIKDSGIIMFHDSTIVYKGIQMILVYLESINLKYHFTKVKNSEMSLLFLGEYNTDELFVSENLEDFFNAAETYRIESLLSNRTKNNQVIDIMTKKIVT